MRIRNLSKFGFFVALLFLVSCDTNKVFDEYKEANSSGWSTTDTIVFEVEMSAAEENLHNYLIGLRNNNSYLYSNIFFFVEVKTPTGESQLDTLQYLLAEPNGKWLGAGVGAIKHNLFKFKEEQAMSSGLYTFKIIHGMRDSVLLGIEDIGLRIERSN